VVFMLAQPVIASADAKIAEAESRQLVYLRFVFIRICSPVVVVRRSRNACKR